MKAYMQRARKGNYHIQEKPRWEHFAEFLTEARKNTRSALGYISTSLSAVESQDITQLSSDVFAEITHVLHGTTADSAVNKVLSDTEITHVLDGTTDGSAVNEVLADTEDLSPLPMRSRLQRILATCKKSTHHQVLTGWGIELLLEGKPSLCFRKFAPDMPDYVEKAIIVRADLTYNVSAHGHGGLRDPSLGDGILGCVDDLLAVLQTVADATFCGCLDYTKYKNIVSSLIPEKVSQIRETNEVDRHVYRSISCSVLKFGNSSGSRCQSCQRLDNSWRKTLSRFNHKGPVNEIKNLKSELKEKIERIAVLEAEVKVLTESMMAISDADHILCKDTLFRDPEVLTKIEENDKMRILFEDQEKFLKLKDKRGMRWHPRIIRFALGIYVKSRGQYVSIAKQGYLQLPDERTLRAYKNCTEGGSGWKDDDIFRMASTYHLWF
ncbi:hypothetical protein CYMTET_27013 [Cymbomonas tetramitiformis]|uniref:Uncharacterized protein n=1 Tax=Cymbomonas tetramitiformis TaxID=36881 RepID=A0AAE0FQX6_9CHLO|nr:hypothetical protein CYMTET_27013 [Cymbomonas tetramitiformis]